MKTFKKGELSIKEVLPLIKNREGKQYTKQHIIYLALSHGFGEKIGSRWVIDESKFFAFVKDRGYGKVSLAGYLPVDEAAKKYHIRDNDIYTAIKFGLIPFKYFHGARYVKEDKLNEIKERLGKN